MLFVLIYNHRQLCAPVIGLQSQPVYVCVCKGITDSEFLELANKHAANPAAKSESTLEHAREMLGMGTGCGCCLDFAGGLLENQLRVEVQNAA